MNSQTTDRFRAAGVTILDPGTTFVDDTVVIGAGTVLYPGVTLEGRTVVGADCRIRSWVRLTDCTVGDRVSISDCCVVVESILESDTAIGPFAHIRPGSVVRERAHVGNFVELKKTTLGAGSKACHLTYLGDATIGAGVNVGAGTITCNYDGVHKNPTVIEDGAFIGSDSQLIAPVRVGSGAYVAAGSSITGDVPPGALGIARSRQRNIAGWADRKKPKATGSSRG